MSLNDGMSPAPTCYGNGLNKIEIPKEIGDELTNMMDNLMAVKGDKFVFMVKFMMNTQGLVSLLAQCTTIDDNVDKPKFKNTLTHIMSTLADMHRDALGIPESEMSEVIRATQAADSLVDHIRKSKS